MRNENKIRRLMQTGMDGDDSPSRALTAVSQARRQTGQRDTLAFALVRIWAALARLLAPLFAAFGEKQARAIHEHTTASETRKTKDNDNDSA